MTDNTRKLEADQAKKLTISKWLSLVVIAEYVVLSILMLTQESHVLPIFIGVFALLFTAVTIFFYFKDMFSGVLKPTAEEEAEYEKMIEQNRIEQEMQRK